ncbi:unnamed protein product [Aureobasidium pullulans]|nr:unnamed protein product [Aureobasidium pullulans]
MADQITPERSIDEKHPYTSGSEPAHAPGLTTEDYEGKPTEEERKTLRRVPGSLPTIAYLICVVEFCERASYYGCQPLFSNFVNRPLPVGGNGYGAPPSGTQQTAGALGMGTVKANAVSQSFSLLCYALPLVFGYLADAKTGRFKLICWGVLLFGIAHVLLPNVSPLLLDQMPETVPVVVTTKKGEKVIIDPEASTERVMLWFYLLINIGGFMGVATAYCEKYIGWWLAFLIPLILYIPLPALLWYLRKRLVLHPPGGSDLPNVFKVLSICFRAGGIKRIGRHGFWEPAKPSVIAAKGTGYATCWDDQFVEDVRRTFQATGIFCFFPIQYLNDNGIGSAASYLTTMLTTNGVPNDVISNFNSLSIILMAPVLNYGLYPLLRKFHISYGPVARMTTGLALSTLGGVGYTVLNAYAYKLGPCGKFGSSETCVDADGLFINVPAYGIAYSRAPPNMRGLVSAINLFSTAIAYLIGLACSAVIKDPYLTWDFGGCAIAGGILTVIFWFTFKHIDKEEYTLSQRDDHHVTQQGHDPEMDGHNPHNPVIGTDPDKVLEYEKKGEKVPTLH